MTTDSIDALQRRLHAVLVRHTQFKELLVLIDQCRRTSQYSDEPQCLALEGQTGAGKSTLVKVYASGFKPEIRDDGTYIKVLYLLTPSPATIGSMLTAMLEALDDPGAHLGTLQSKESRLVKLLDECGVELIILDDFQHLVDSETNYVLRRVSDWLKALIKRTQKPFVVVGVEGKVRRVLASNPQLSRLFRTPETLQPFVWKGVRHNRGKGWITLVNSVEKAAGVKFCSDLPRAELLTRLHYATNGVVGNFMNLVRTAAWIAHEKGATDFDLAVFAEAFRQRLSEHLWEKVNPFLVPANKEFVPPTKPKRRPDPPEGAGNRSRRRKGRGQTAEEVLRTS